MRPHQAGHLRKDGRWQLTVTLTAADGGKHDKTLYAKTQREVQEKARKFLATNGRVAHQKRTVEDLIEAYKANRWPELSKGAKGQHRPAYKRLVAHFGKTDLRKIKAPDVAMWVRSMEKEVDERKITGRTVQAYRNVFSTLQTFARELGWIEENTAKGIKLRRSAKPHSRRRLTPYEYQLILEKEENAVLRDYWEFLGETGMRPDEALKLRVEKIFYYMDVWWIRGGGKTPAGTDREIPLPDKLANRLLDRASQNPSPATTLRGRSVNEENGEGVSQESASPWLFPYQPGGPNHKPQDRPYNYRHVVDKWAEACEAAAVPYTNVYQLRKMAISRWIASGLPDDVVLSLGGHASICLTKDVYLRLGRDRLLKSLFTDFQGTWSVKGLSGEMEK